MMGWYDHGAWQGWGMVLMVIAWLLVVVAIVWVGVRVGQSSAPQVRPSTESARQVLDRRLANGEIDEQQYARARRLIEADAGQRP